MQETQEAWVQSLGWEDPPSRRKWQPTPVLLPGESHGQRSLVGYSLWVCKRVGDGGETEHKQAGSLGKAGEEEDMVKSEGQCRVLGLTF